MEPTDKECPFSPAPCFRRREAERPRPRQAQRESRLPWVRLLCADTWPCTRVVRPVAAKRCAVRLPTAPLAWAAIFLSAAGVLRPGNFALAGFGSLADFTDLVFAAGFADLVGFVGIK